MTLDSYLLDQQHLSREKKTCREENAGFAMMNAALRQYTQDKVNPLVLSAKACAGYGERGKFYSFS